MALLKCLTLTFTNPVSCFSGSSLFSYHVLASANSSGANLVILEYPPRCKISFSNSIYKFVNVSLFIFSTVLGCPLGSSNSASLVL